MALDRETKAAIDRAARLAGERAGEAAVKKTLLTLGIDASTPAEIREFQKDMAQARRNRLAVEGRGRYFIIIFSTGMTVLGAGLTMLIQRIFGVSP
jgi:hypothetical protein